MAAHLVDRSIQVQAPWLASLVCLGVHLGKSNVAVTSHLKTLVIFFDPLL
jgi:hypothetical protein